MAVQFAWAVAKHLQSGVVWFAGQSVAVFAAVATKESKHNTYYIQILIYYMHTIHSKITHRIRIVPNFT